MLDAKPFSRSRGRFWCRSRTAASAAVSSAALAAVELLGAARNASARAGDACDTQAVVERALPSTVNITVVKVVTGAATDDGHQAAPHFEVFVGSGAIVDPSGIIITNKHVIEDGARIWIAFADHTQARAQLIAAATLLDLAVLKVNEARPRPALRFADSDSLRPGQPVIAVGDPLGLGTSVSSGVVSAVNRDLMRTPFDDFIQTDASINPGNSGGPLINCDGDIVGVDTLLVSNNAVLGSIGIGFALPSNDVKVFVHRVIDAGDPPPNWVGLHLQDITARLATAMGLRDVTGAIVTGVDTGSPAEIAGLAAGDIVTGVNGQMLFDARAIGRAVIKAPSGEPIVFAVSRGRDTLSLSAVGKPWPNMMARRGDVLASEASLAIAQAAGVGLGVTSLTDADRQRLHLGNAPGVLIDQVTPGSRAAAMALAPGDVIERVGNAPANRPEDVINQLTHGDPARGDVVALLVRGASRTRWITLYVGRVDITDLVAPPPSPRATITAHEADAEAK